MKSHRFTKTEQNFQDNSGYPGKPYSQYPVKVQRKLMSTDLKQRSSGSKNMLRKVDLNNLKEMKKSGEISAIRKVGKSYQKKLQNNYDGLRIHEEKTKIKCGPNYERDLRYWYSERMKGIDQCYTQFLKKLQKQLGENAYIKQEKENLLNEMNKAWQEKVPKKLKKCFQP